MADEQHITEPTQWTIHGERTIDDTRRLKLSIASVELPNGVRFEQYVLRMPKASMVVVLDDSHEHVLMIWRHRFVMDKWTWELPGGYVDPNEDPAITAAREVEEETGWRPRSLRKVVAFQPTTGTADFENIVYVSSGAIATDIKPDINEAARVEWIRLESVPERIRAGEIIGAGAQVGLMSVMLNI